MNNLNSVLLEGHLTQDPTLKQIESKSLCTFSIGCNRFYKKDDVNIQETSFFQIEFWGKTAENCAKYLHKGNGIRIVGRLKQERWKDANDNARQTIKVIGEHADFFPKKKQSSNSKEQENQNFEAESQVQGNTEVEEVSF